MPSHWGFWKLLRTTNLLAKRAAAKASEFSKVRRFRLRIRWFGKRAQTKGLLKEETGLWLQHRAMWDWKSALGLAEEKRHYEIDGGSIRFLHTVRVYISKPSKIGFRSCYLSSVSLISVAIKRGLDNIICFWAGKGNDPWRYIDITILVKMVTTSDLKATGFLTSPKATVFVYSFIHLLN